MNQSKTGLNGSFYKWCDDVSRAIWKIKEFDDRLRYYEGKLVGYKSVAYDQIKIGKSSSASDDMIIFWMDKIHKLEKSHLKYCVKYDEYIKFRTLLTDRQKYLLQYLIEKKVDRSIHMSYEESKNLIPIIARKWFDNYSDFHIINEGNYEPKRKSRT